MTEAQQALEIAAGARWLPAGVISLLIYAAVGFSNFAILVAVLKKRIEKARGFTKLAKGDVIIMHVIAMDTAYSFGQLVVLGGTGANLNNSPTACIAPLFLTAFPLASQLLLVLLAATRYSIVRDKMTGSGMSNRKIAMWIVIIVVIAVGFGAFTLFTPATPTVSGLNCGIEPSTLVNRLIFVIGTIATGGAVFYYYVRVWRIVSADAHSANGRAPREFLHMILVLNVAFVVSQLNWSVLSFYRALVGSSQQLGWETAAFIIAALSFLANPIAYCTFVKRYREAVFDVTGISYLRGRLGFDSRTTRSSQSPPSPNAPTKLRRINTTSAKSSSAWSTPAASSTRDHRATSAASTSGLPRVKENSASASSSSIDSDGFTKPKLAGDGYRAAESYDRAAHRHVELPALTPPTPTSPYAEYQFPAVSAAYGHAAHSAAYDHDNAAPQPVEPVRRE